AKTCTYSTSLPITIRNIISDFDRNGEASWPPPPFPASVAVDTAHCIGLQDVFTNTSTNATSWSWNFGDGSTSLAFSPTHTYAAVGVYTVMLAISDTQYGCKDTLRKAIKIYALPTATVTAPENCKGQPSQLSVSGGPGYTYVW